MSTHSNTRAAYRACSSTAHVQRIRVTSHSGEPCLRGRLLSFSGMKKAGRSRHASRWQRPSTSRGPSSACVCSSMSTSVQKLPSAGMSSITICSLSLAMSATNGRHASIGQ